MAKKASQPKPHPKDGRPILLFESQAQWRAWIKRNLRACDGVWIQFAKKSSGLTSINYAEALDVALCHGWIDSQVMRLDERFYLQRFTPRGAKSIWSKINCEKVQKLIDAGEMTEHGLKHVEAAKADGRWDRAYAGPKSIEVPPDFAKLLKKNRKAAVFFQTLSSANRYAILFRIHDAKKAETRQKRMEQFIQMLVDGKTIH